MTGIDPWFLDQMQQIVDMEKRMVAELAAPSGARGLHDETLRQAKRMGFSDSRIAQLFGAGVTEADIARARLGRGDQARLQARRTPAPGSSSRTRRTCIRPTRRSERPIPTDRKKVLILGSGPNRIGQGMRVRLLLLPRRLRVQGRGLRDHHGQLQPGDGVDRLRHLRPGCTSSP